MAMGSGVSNLGVSWPELWKALEPLATWSASQEIRRLVADAARDAAVARGWRTAEMGVDGPRLENGRWHVELWWSPRMPGGHAVVTVSGDGKVLGCWRAR